MGLTPAGTRCWRVIGAGGAAPWWQADGEPHHTSLDEAVEEIAERLTGDLDDPTDDPVLSCRPQRYPRPCVTVTCDACGSTLEDDEGGWLVHFPGPGDPDVECFGWAGDGAGRHFCGCPDTPSPAGLAAADRRPCPYDVPLPLPLPWDGPS